MANRKRVKFVAYTETTESATAIGLTRLAGSKTKAIYALYYEHALSRREAAKVIADVVYPARARVIAAGSVKTDRVNVDYAGVIHIHGGAYKPGTHEEPRLLANDAIERKEGTAEVFDESVKYECQGLFDAQ